MSTMEKTAQNVGDTRHSPATASTAAPAVLGTLPTKVPSTLAPTEPLTELSQNEIGPQSSSLRQSFPWNLSPSAATRSTEASSTTTERRRTRLRAMIIEDRLCEIFLPNSPC